MIGLVLFSISTQAHPVEKNPIFEAEKKALYYELKAKLLKNEITLKQAQRLWKRQIEKIRDKEGK